MKFSDETLSILKNFSQIQQTLMFRPGNELRTMSERKNILAVSLFDEPDVEFGEEKFVISSGRQRVKYTYAAENMLLVPPEKDIDMASIDAEVDMPWDDLQNVIRAAGVLQLPEIAFVSRDGILEAQAVNSKNPTTDKFDIDLDCSPTKDFKILVKVENLRLLPRDYRVRISTKGLVHFSTDGLDYFIAAEAK